MVIAGLRTSTRKQHKTKKEILSLVHELAISPCSRNLPSQIRDHGGFTYHVAAHFGGLYVIAIRTGQPAF